MKPLLCLMAALAFLGCREDLAWRGSDASAPDDAGASGALDASQSIDATAIVGEDASAGPDGGLTALEDAGDAGVDDAGPPEFADGSVGDAGLADAAGGLEPFEFLTSGGARLSSSKYRMDVYVAPLSPVGSGETGNYRIKLGPAPLGVSR